MHRRPSLAGSVRVTVVGDGLYHSVSFPPGAESIAQAARLVNRARALASSSPNSSYGTGGIRGSVTSTNRR